MRLVTDEGIKEMTKQEALEIAEAEVMNLVAVNNDSVPVCKLMDYSKYLYNAKKAAKSNKKSAQETKEIKINYGCAEYDMGIKAKNIDRILSEGDKVKVSMTFKGRAVQFVKSGIDKLESVEAMITYNHTVDRKPTIEGNRVIMVVSPVK